MRDAVVLLPFLLSGVRVVFKSGVRIEWVE